MLTNERVVSENSTPFDAAWLANGERIRKGSYAWIYEDNASKKITGTSVAAIDAPTDEPADDGLGDLDDCFGPGGLDDGCGLGGPDDIGGFDGTVGSGGPSDDIVS